MAVNASMRGSLARSLLAAAHDLEAAMTAALRGSGLGVPHYLVLSHLDENGPASTSELGRVALVPAATLTRTLDRLVDLALVHRALDAGDRRRIIIRLTERGRSLVEEQAQAIDEALASALPQLREWEAQALTDMLGADTTAAE